MPMLKRYETFTVLISKIHRSIKKLKNSEMAEYGLRSRHISCLYFLYTGLARTSTELCESCEEDKATVSRALSFLEKNGYITHAEPPSKRYRVALVLTEKGRETGERIASRIDSILNEASKSLSEKERAELYRALTVVSDTLDRLSSKGE